MLDIKLKAREDKRVRAGHLWIFSNEIENLDKTAVSGSLCRVLSAEGDTVGYGYFNPHSLISVRLLKRGKEPLEKSFIQDYIDAAYGYRKEIGLRKYGRMVYGESDMLPGLIIDRYGDILVIDILTAGMELLKEDITKAVKKIFKPKGIIYKNDSSFRIMENLPVNPEIMGEVPQSVIIEENKVEYEVPLSEGQKTGFYFDQRENREFLKPYFKDKLVLDLYSYIGAFGIYAAKNGAAQVWGTDSSALAVEYANKNAKLNGVEDIVTYKRDDAERLLSAMGKKELPDQPDFVLLDPPAFVKNRKSLPQAINLYVKLNRMALEGLEPGGYLATSTCSHHISREIFVDIIRQAAYKAGKRVVMLELRGQAKDHPVLVGMPETEYLHFALLQVR
ncbi:putative SAM-dependent methyltransferases [Elusimicrobium minutum Pei191]|uniref:Putative SAM-dependent methyltransferases n=1 Tax=Elusimicrobium minutum (strain Pei191) TaxID=445932 RepID=B2KEE6_ELUMP|nr:class I SAM-dependent rRNA methyltransferase [Elusimicrobium minutum]ACC98892.1 putative SAM-dependent methyltransferases [Elusimicrobium minutum Pei191]